MKNNFNGRSFGDYQLLEKIGSGGMATVFKAVHKDNPQKVALKVLHEQYNDNPQIRLRFEREAKISARLEHSHIVPILGFGEFKGRFYLVMPFMEGGNLAGALSDKILVDYKTSLEMLGALAAGLDYAHGKGVIHRDFKLENILLDKMNTPAISDFGIAQSPDVTSITMTGQLLGSPQYFAPENFEEMAAVDYRIDLYAFAVMAYLMFTGYFPFTGPNALSIIYQHRHEDIPLPTKVNPQLAPALDEIFSKALAKNPDERFASAQELVSQLDTAFVNLPPGAATVFLKHENPAAASNFATTPTSIQQAMNADGNRQPGDINASATMVSGYPQTSNYKKLMTPLFLGGWLFACSVLGLMAQNLIPILNAQAADSEQDELKAGQTLLATESDVFTSTATVEASETERPTVRQTGTVSSSASVSRPSNQSQSQPITIIAPAEQASSNTSANQNPPAANLPANTQVPRPTNPPPTNPPANTQVPPTSVAPTNPPAPTNVAPTNPPLTNPPPTEDDGSSGRGGSGHDGGSGRGGSG